jgi:DNA-binding FadR family transcriptional regulator
MVVSISNKRDAKEREAARLAAQHRTPADLARLESALAELKAPPEAGFKDLHEFNRFRNAGREFHLAIAAASNNATLCADITELIDQLYWWLGHNVPHKKGQRDQHAAIVEAIRNQDANAAAEAMVVHSMNARDALDELLLHHLPSMTITTVLDMRQQAEGLAARLAAERHTPEDDQRLIKALSLTRDIPEGGFHTFEEAAAFREADRTLHMAIATAAHDPVVYNIVSVVYRNYSDLLSGIDLHLKGFRPRQTDDHATIVEAIREGRPDDAAKVTSDHIAFTRKVVDQELAALWFDLANAD